MIPWVITRIASIVVRFVSFYFVASGSCCYDVTFVHKSDVVLEIYGLQSSADPCTESSSSLMLSEKDGFAVDEHLLEAL